MTDDTQNTEVQERKIEPLEGQVLPKLPVIYTRFEQMADFKEAIDTCDELRLAGEQFLTLTDPEQRDLAAEFLARARKQVTDTDKMRLQVTAGPRAITKAFNDGTSGRTKPLEELNKKVTGAIMKFNAEERQRAEAEERARQEEERQRQAAAEAEAEAERQRIIDETGLEPPAAPESETSETSETPPPPMKSTTRVQGTYGSTATEVETWHWKIVDINLVPESFLVPPEDRVVKSTLNALARGQKDKASVPGVEFYPEKGLTTRAAG